MFDQVPNTPLTTCTMNVTLFCCQYGSISHFIKETTFQHCLCFCRFPEILNKISECLFQTKSLHKIQNYSNQLELFKCVCGKYFFKSFVEIQCGQIKYQIAIQFPLKSDHHVEENFCQIKIFPSLVRKNTIICLFRV